MWWELEPDTKLRAILAAGMAREATRAAWARNRRHRRAN